MMLVRVLEFESDPLVVFNLCATTGCSSYDVEYVLFARESAARVVTADEQLLKAFPDDAVSIEDFARGK